MKSNQRKISNFVLFCAMAGIASFAPVGAGASTLDELKKIEKETKDVVKKVTPATVGIFSTSGGNGWNGVVTGSGVIVSPGGLVLTAAHVVEGENQVTIVFEDGKKATGKVLGANYFRDAAMIKIEGKGPWPYVQLGDSSSLKVGEFVVALGHSKGFDATRRTPVRLGRLHTDGKQRFMISECTLIGGDSGGPLFDLNGKLVGIHSSIGPLLRINNHVPVDAFKSDWSRLEKGDRWGVLGSHPMSDPDSPLLGCSIDQVIGVEGAVVIDVLAESPADKAGLKSGDVIVRVSDRVVAKPEDLRREMERFKPGENVDMVVVRRGQPYKTALTLGRTGDVLELFYQNQE